MQTIDSSKVEERAPAQRLESNLADGEEPRRRLLELRSGGRKTIVAGVHLLPLPGSPAYDRDSGMRSIVRRARQDAEVLADRGVDAILFTNEADTPYAMTLNAETVAAFTEAVAEATRNLVLPFGVNALLDTVAGLAIAHATGGSFIRGYFTGAYATDSGFMDTKGPDVLRLRAQIGASSVLVLHNLVCPFGAPIAPRPIGLDANGALVHGRVDGFTISAYSGEAPALDLFDEVRRAAPGLPILAGTGVTVSNVQEILAVADGVIVVSSLREDGALLNPIVPERVDAFMDRVRASRA
jgi:membrane complex biogenesis BtpA family protein